MLVAWFGLTVAVVDSFVAAAAMTAKVMVSSKHRHLLDEYKAYPIILVAAPSE